MLPLNDSVPEGPLAYCRGSRLAASHLAIWFLASLACGCGSKLPTVEGTVTMDGEPLPNAKVVFEAPDRPMAVATTDDLGRYDVRTGNQRGMAAGSYKVAISAYASRAGGTESPVPILVTPKRYNSARSSGLAVEIKAGRNEEVDFQLETD